MDVTLLGVDWVTNTSFCLGVVLSYRILSNEIVQRQAITALILLL